MTVNITLRIAWHSSGWNGHICDNPERNTYCVGRHSYPGDLIKYERDLSWEMREDVKGKPCGGLSSLGSPACGYSINAFGNQQMKAISNPPDWFRDGSKPAFIDIPPSTVCIWPYEGMYGEDVKNAPGSGQKYDYKTRLKNAEDYFAQLKEGRSLLFYYANYSNPFSEDDSPKYAIVGVSRLKKMGKIHYYDNVSDINKKKYAGGFVWQMPITSNYPEEGLLIPYHKYLDNPEVLKRILFIPNNPRNFKYATRPVTEDDALTMVEKFIEITNYLIEIGDNTQNWDERRKWLLSLFTDLWKQRGAYPGLPQVLEHIGFNEGIAYYKNRAEKTEDKLGYAALTDFLTGKSAQVQDLPLSPSRLKEIRRNWQLIETDEKELLINILPRFALSTQQIQNIVQTERAKNNLYTTLQDIINNPYLLSEQYTGDDIDDLISFNTVDHGILPNPELGLGNIFPKNSAERFRALCIDVLKRETIHSFISQSQILFHVNNRLNHLPSWKNHQFTTKYFEVDAEFMEKAIKPRKHKSETYYYLLDVYEDERLVESVIRDLQQRPDIKIKVELNEKHFCDLLKDTNSDLVNKAPEQYDAAIVGQASVCGKVFTKPICVISGAAGTGKTTVIKSIITGIEKVHGVATNITLLAPTGKASEKIKEKTHKPASTIHSFLANPERGWLNDNFTFKRIGGKIDSTINTLIIDECSMINLALFAALFKSINWNTIQRLILVGDPNQLPPIGRGRVFSDIIEWMKNRCPENLGKLDINVRQLENKVKNEGNGILDLAEIYIQEKQKGIDFDKAKQEQILKKIQQGGAIDKDLTVLYWNEMDDLETQLKAMITDDLEKDTKEKAELNELWNKAIRLKGEIPDATYLQILSPFRGEFFGTDYLNGVFQDIFNGNHASRSLLDGIALYDKVIQFRNRPKSNMISAYSWEERKNVKIDIYNGEIGFVYPHPFDKSRVSWNGFRLQNFQVKLVRRNDYSINYGFRKDENTGKTMFNEPVEENLELGYALSVHKAQGSEFDRVYLILPQRSSPLLSMELLYTAVTRSKKHLTIFAQRDIATFIELSKFEKSSIGKINSSVFDFSPIPDMLFALTSNWYDSDKVIATLSDYFVRSKSEMNIANILSLKGVPFAYEVPLFAKDGSMYLPDFTIHWRGDDYYWEHVGRLDLPVYRNHWETKKSWYEKHFPGKLIETYESNMQSKDIDQILSTKFGL